MEQGMTKPFGLKQLVIGSMNEENILTLPAALTMEFEEVVVSGEFYGNDELQGLVTQPLGVKGKFNMGGLPLEAYALMTGHSYEKTGSTPNEVATLDADSPTFPYFKVWGQSLGDEGDDVHIKLEKVKLTSSPKGKFERGQFFMLEAEFMGVKVDGQAYEIAANETSTDLDVPEGETS
jgi:hypothetical protein